MVAGTGYPWVNVWCAAGKGTFSTKELVNRINLTSLDKIINHRRIILPQLGATGVSAHELKALTSLTVNNPVVLNAIPDTSQFKKMVSGIKTNRGYTVVYGPVRANDIKAFILNNYKALPEMRKVNYNFTERVKLIPNDFMYGIKHLLIAFLIMFIISSIGNFSLPLQKLILPGLTAILNTFIAYVTGIVITPMLLPFIPFRRFALKGLSISLISSSILFASNKFGNNTLEIVSWYLISGAIASYTAMNFTGSSTYTSLSGVKVEMKLALPVQIASAACGIIMVIVSKLI